MDLGNVPEVKISKEKEKEIQKWLQESYKESKRSYEEWISKMRKAGYSDEEIDMMMCF